MKKVFCILLFTALLTGTAGCSTPSADVTPPQAIDTPTVEPPPQAPVPDSLLFKEEHEVHNGNSNEAGTPYREITIRPDNRVIYLEEETVRTFLESGTGIFFFSNSTCPWCRTFMPMFMDFADDYDVDLFYFNPVEDREADTALNQFLVSKLHDYLAVDESTQNPEEEDFDPEKKRIRVPHVFFMNHGEVVEHIFLNGHALLREETLDLEQMREMLDEMYDSWLVERGDK